MSTNSNPSATSDSCPPPVIRTETLSALVAVGSRPGGLSDAHRQALSHKPLLLLPEPLVAVRLPRANDCRYSVTSADTEVSRAAAMILARRTSSDGKARVMFLVAMCVSVVRFHEKVPLACSTATPTPPPQCWPARAG